MMPVARFQMPDGRIGRFEVPDGTTADQAQSLIESHLSQSALPQPESPKQGGGIGQFMTDTAVAGGRMATDAVSGLAGIVGNPLNASINLAGEAMGYHPNLSTDIHGQAMNAYDTATDNRGVPAGAAGRIAQAAGSSLLGGGALGGVAKAAGAAPAIVEALGVNSVPSMLSELGAGAGAQAGTEISPDHPAASFLGGLIGSATPMALASAPRAIAKATGINAEKIATLDAAGLPVNMVAASDSPAMKTVGMASANLPGGSALRKSMDTAFQKAQDEIKTLGYTGTNTPASAGNLAREGLERWQANKAAKLDNFKQALNQVIPPDSPVNLDDFGNKIEKLAASFGGSKTQTQNILNNKAFQQAKIIYDDAMQSHTRLSRLSADELQNLQKYQQYDLEKLYDFRKQLMDEASASGNVAGSEFSRRIRPQSATDLGLGFDRSFPEVADVRQWARNTFAPEGVKAQKQAVEAAQGAAGYGQLAGQGEQALKEINDAIAMKLSGQAGSVPLSALDWARTEVGSLIKQDVKNDRVDAISKQVYGLLANTAENHAGQVAGARGQQMLKTYNKAYGDFVSEQTKFVNNMVRRLDNKPEALANWFYRNNSTQAMQGMSRLTPAEREVVRDGIIYNKGGGDNFSVAKWANEYSKMDADTKRAFFLGNPDLAKAHDKLVEGIKVYQDVGKFKNTSNTAMHDWAIKLLTGANVAAPLAGGASALGVSALATGAGVLANKAVSSILASPRATVALSNILKHPPATQAAFFSSLTKALKASGMTDQDVQGNIEQMKRDAIAPDATPPAGIIKGEKAPLTEQITPQSQMMTAPSIDGGLSDVRGVRNKNPFNLRGNDDWYGKKGSDEQGFAQFAYPTDGLRAGALNLINQQKKHGVRNIRQLITKYAPPNENDTEAYINKVAKFVGVTPNQDIQLSNKATLSRVMNAILMQENGKHPYTPKMIENAATLALKGK